MKTRERTLLILLGAAAGLLVVRTVVGRYTGALGGYDAQIDLLHRDLEKSQQEKAKAQEGRAQWLEIGSQTLSMDGNEATTRLREEMTKLTEKSGLRDVDVALESAPKPWMKNRVRVLSFSVAGQGKLDDVVAFLFELHSQPYAVRVKGLTLDLVDKPTRRREVKSSQRGLLNMKALLDTLILPANQMAAKIEPAGLEAGKRKEVKRTELASLVDYKPLLDKKLFQPYEPPASAAPRIADKTRPPVNVTPQPVRVVQPPPPADAEMVLGRLLSSPRGQLAVLEDRRKPNVEDTYKEVGEEMYGGTLVFVHPQGAVTQRDGQWWFHAIGEPLQNCKPLTEQDQPMVYSELMKLVSEATGITRRPG